MSKWKKVAEVCEAIAEDRLYEMQFCLNNRFEHVGYAPHIGERAWLFRYKGLFISLWDMGNGHWQLHSVATWWDYIRVAYRQKRRKK